MEKFWSHGVEPMRTLVADHLSDTPTLSRFWRNRPQRLPAAVATNLTRPKITRCMVRPLVSMQLADGLGTAT